MCPCCIVSEPCSLDFLFSPADLIVGVDSEPGPRTDPPWITRAHNLASLDPPLYYLGGPVDSLRLLVMRLGRDLGLVEADS